MIQLLKRYVFKRNEELAPADRILGHHLARELTDEEINEVAGGDCCWDTKGQCDCYA